MSMSINGLVTRSNNDDFSWQSKEDKEHFLKLKSQYSLIIMGRKTYDYIRHKLVLDPKMLRVVVTHHPDRYSSNQINNQLEFINLDPITLVHNLETRGFKKALLAGGPNIATQFLNCHLINEIYLTIEPIIISYGIKIFEIPNEEKMTLIESKTLNSKGALILNYKINK